jgi:hypothetical protein
MANPQKVKGAKKLHIHVIVNNALIPEFAMTSNSTLSVAGRAYAVLVKSQTKQSLLALYNYALRSDVEFRYAAISQAVPYSMLDPFNKDYMNAVYKLGYEGTLNGKIWLQTPSFQSPANQKTVSGVPLSAVD